MTSTIEVYFDVGSPASYLAWTQLPALAQRHGAQIEWQPMLLGGVFKATGNQSPAVIPAKGRYMRQDLQRFAQNYGVAFNYNPYFPINTLHLMRGAIAYLDTQRFEDYLHAVFNALWVDQRDMNQMEVVGGVLQEAGFDPGEVMGRISEPAVKDRLKQITETAVRRGVFGAPTFFLGDEMFFGQDRLDVLEQVLVSSGEQ